LNRFALSNIGFAGDLKLDAEVTGACRHVDIGRNLELLLGHIVVDKVQLAILDVEGDASSQPWASSSVSFS
jgi:hypothetical protein